MGSIFFYQNGKKDLPKVYDIEKMTASKFIRFIKEHTTYDLNLPHDSHIPEDMLDDYYEEKAEGLTIVEDDYLYKVDL